MLNRRGNAAVKRSSSATSIDVPVKRQRLMTGVQSGETKPLAITSTMIEGNGQSSQVTRFYMSTNETIHRHESTNNTTSSILRSLTILNRKKYLDNIFKEITLDKADKQRSKRLVDCTLKSIIDRCARGIYKRQYIDAGSYPVKLKINKADEFDVNIPLNIEVKGVRMSGNVTYAFKDVSCSLFNCELNLFSLRTSMLNSIEYFLHYRTFNLHSKYE